MKRRITEAQKAHVAKYVKNHYSKLSVLVPKDFKDVISKTAKEAGLSTSRFFLNAVCEKYGLDEPEDKSFHKKEEEGE